MTRTATSFLSLALCATLASSCSTQRDTQRLGGAVIGALLGGTIALIDIGIDPAAAIGAGAAIGFGSMLLIQSSEERLASADANVERDRWNGGPVTNINEASVEPQVVRPGEALTFLTTYSVLAATGESSTAVEETWVLRRDGVEIAVLGSKLGQRLTGRWESSPQLLTPSDIQPGEYEVEHRVRVEGSFDTRRASFQVAG
ncbi:MAG: hypothetical protein ACI91F_000923 [Candidatus Binatia bacterium]